MGAKSHAKLKPETEKDIEVSSRGILLLAVPHASSELACFRFFMQDDNESKVALWVSVRRTLPAVGVLANWLDAIIFPCRTAYHVVGMASFAPAKLCMSKASRRHGSMNH